MGPAFLMALLAFSAGDSRLLPELREQFGSVEWVSLEGSLLLDLKGGLVFKPGSADLDRTARKDLDRLSRLLLKNPHMRLELIGTAGAEKPGEEAEELARLRASTARNYILSGMHTLCQSLGSPPACERPDRRVTGRAGDPPIQAVTGQAERAQADRVRLLLGFSSQAAPATPGR